MALLPANQLHLCNTYPRTPSFPLSPTAAHRASITLSSPTSCALSTISTVSASPKNHARSEARLTSLTTSFTTLDRPVAGACPACAAFDGAPLGLAEDRKMARFSITMPLLAELGSCPALLISLPRLPKRLPHLRRFGLRGCPTFCAFFCGCVHLRQSPVRHSFSGGGASFCGPSVRPSPFVFFAIFAATFSRHRQLRVHQCPFAVPPFTGWVREKRLSRAGRLINLAA